jgi:predicted  nucleic acid-binding Zn-ribbon protein
MKAAHMETPILDRAVAAARERSERVNARMLALRERAQDLARVIADAQSHFDSAREYALRVQFELSEILAELDTELDRLARREGS